MTDQEHLNLPATRGGGEVEGMIFDGEVVVEEDRAPGPSAPPAPVRAALLHVRPHARVLGRHAGYVAAGTVVAARRRRRRRTLMAEMAHLAAARGELDKAAEWAQRDHEHQHQRAERQRKAWEAAGRLLHPQTLKGIAIAAAAVAVLLVASGWMRYLVGLYHLAAVTLALAWDVRWAVPPAVLLWLWNLGRTAGGDLAPKWSLAAKPGDEGRGLVVTADGITVALQNLGLPKLDKAFKGGWQPSFQLTPVRDGEGYSAVFSLPLGVTVSMVADKNEVLARNLHRAACEVWVTDAERAKLAPAGFVSLYVLNPGALDRPTPEWPLLHEGQADVFKGVPGGAVARGDQTRIPVIANNLVLGGQMGMGKSNAGRVFILGCATDPLCELNVFVFAGNGDFDSFAPRLATYVKGADDDTAAAAVQHLHDLLDEVDRREGRLAELGAKKLTRRIAEQHPDMRPSVSLFSECHELFGSKALTFEGGKVKYGELAAELAVKVIKRARKTGIVLAFDTQSSRAAAIPPELVELVSVNVCFYVKTWRSNDGFLGDGSFQAGIRATELRPTRDVGRAVVTGITDAQFDLLKWHYIFSDDDTGEDDARPVIERCMRELAPGTRVSGGDGAALPVIVVRDLLDDLAEVAGPDRIRLADLPARLRKLAPAYGLYRGLTGVQLRDLLDELDVRTLNPKNVPTLDPADLRKALTGRGELAVPLSRMLPQGLERGLDLTRLTLPVDLTIAGQRATDARLTAGEKPNPLVRHLTREESEMPHKFRQEQADKLVAIRRGMDLGTATEAQLIAARMESTGQELDDAMQQYDADDYERWGH